MNARLGRRMLTLTALAIAVAALTMLGSAQARADQVTCGETITKDTTLDNDLIDCPGDGIIIGADNITVDLNGHTISGAGTGSGVNNSGVVNQGNFVSPGHDWVTIENGTIKDFGSDLNYPFAEGFGIDLDHGADHNRLSKLSLSENKAGIQIDHSDATVIEKSSVSANSFLGIHVVDSDYTAIDKSSVFENRRSGIDLYQSSYNVIDKDSVFDNAGSGIDGSRMGVVISRSSIVSNGGYGASLQHGGATIEKSDISANESAGIAVHRIDVYVVGSTVNDNGGDGVTTGAFAGGVFERNVISRNAHDGINLFDISGCRCEGNVVNQNGHDGIHVGSGTLTKNTANDNGNLGIEAVPGVIDGGGNKASGNGNPLQCLYVECK
jgi:parallel beta-helix repeat protein